VAKTEQEHHRRAFEVYCSLGARRSYRRVAEQLGVSVSSVKAWARQGKWQQRLQEREAEIAQQSAGKSVESAITDLAQLRKITRLGLMRVAKQLANGHDISKQIADLDRIVRLITYLDGGPKGPDPKNVEDVKRFFSQIPNEVLDAIEGCHAIDEEELRAIAREQRP